MALNKPWSTLCLLSLSVPALGFGSPFWFFSSAPDSTCSKVIERREPACSDKCGDKCEPKCDAPKPCCTTKTVTEVIKVCEDPCHPKHCDWEAVLSFGIGYRHDKLTQKLSPHSSSSAASLKSRYTDVDSVMGVLRFDGRVKNFLFGVEGDYAPNVDSKLDQRFSGTAAQDAHFDFSNMWGYEADAQATIGYRLEFINGRHGRAYLVPQVGYSYSHQAYETYGEDDFTSSFFAGNVVQFLQDQSPMHSEWYGPFIEARLTFVFWNHFFVNPYYQYHWVNYHARKKLALTGITIDPTVVGAPVSQQTIMKAVMESDSARGQSAGVDLYWQFDNQFRLGGKGSWNSYQTRDGKARVKNVTTTYSTNPPVTTESFSSEDAHAKWTNYSFYLYGGYSF